MENWGFEIAAFRLFFTPPCKLCVSVPLCEIRAMPPIQLCANVKLKHTQKVRWRHRLCQRAVNAAKRIALKKLSAFARPCHAKPNAVP